MNYFLIKTTDEESQQTQYITRFDNAKSAVMAFHQELAAAMAYDTVKSCLCVVMNEYGVIMNQERYVRDGEPE